MAKNWIIIFGVVFVLVGVLGLLGGVGIVGSDGFFVTNGAHDWVHLVTGILFLIVGFAAAQSAGMTMKIFGIVYLLVAVLGFVMETPLLGFLAYNMNDNILHLVLGVVITWAGFSGGKSMSAPMTV